MNHPAQVVRMTCADISHCPPCKRTARNYGVRFATLLRSQTTVCWKRVGGRAVTLSLEMDYAGQKLAEQLNFYILIGLAVIALCAGYIAGSFGLLVKIYAAGLLLDAALVVPDWRWLNKEPLQWLPPLDDQVHEIEQIKGKRKS